MALKKSMGFNTIGLLVTMALTVAGITAALAVFKTISKGFAKVSTDSQANAGSKLVTNSIRTHLEGTRGVQNVAFRVNGLQSIGPGYVVETGVNFDGGLSPANDRILFVQRPTGAAEFKLTSNYNKGDMAINLKVTDPAKNLSDVLAPDDIIGLTNTQFTDMVRVLPVVPGANAGALNLGIAADGAYLYTYIPTGTVNPTLLSNYLENDVLYKVQIMRMGIDTITNQIKVGTLTGAGQPIGSGAADYFVVEARLNQNPNRCAAYQPDPTTFSRAAWAAISGADNERCHSRISGLKLKFGVRNPRLVANTVPNPNEPLVFNYEVLLNAAER